MMKRRRVLYTVFSSETKEPHSDVDTFVKTINTAVQAFNMKILAGVDEVDGADCFALINILDNPVSRCSNMYRPGELELFKSIVSTLMTSEECYIGRTAAINLVTDIPFDTPKARVSLSEAEELIDRWIRDRVFTMTSDENKFTFGVRGILELTAYLRSQFPDYCRDCILCKNICVLGESCDSCDERAHSRCLNTYYTTASSEKFPVCGHRRSFTHALEKRTTMAAQSSTDDDTEEDDAPDNTSRPEKARTSQVKRQRVR